MKFCSGIAHACTAGFTAADRTFGGQPPRPSRRPVPTPAPRSTIRTDCATIPGPFAQIKDPAMKTARARRRKARLGSALRSRAKR